MMPFEQTGEDAMDDRIVQPWQSEYVIENTETIAETPDLRVLRITLAEGDFIPWHYHSIVTDSFVCLEGDLQVETRAPRNLYRMAPGQECAVPAKTAHVVTNRGSGRCRFMVIQGIGPYDWQAVGG